MSTVAVSEVPGESLAQELEELFRKHYQLVYRTAYGVTGSAEDAEDVLQSLFLRFVGRGFPTDLRNSPKGYLYRAAFNLSLNILRARKRHPSADDAERVETPVRMTDSHLTEEVYKQ